jgi:hypothetical protein
MIHLASRQLHRHPTMAIMQRRPIRPRLPQHPGATPVFRQMRLLVGWHVWENNKTEAWLGVITPSEAAGDPIAYHPIDWYHAYTTSDGAKQMGHGIMDVNEVHPAMLEHHERESGEVVLNKGRTERLGYLADRHHRVTTGRWMYCEQEGGGLKVMPPLIPHSPAKKEKRKRSLSSSDASECTTSNQRRQRSRYEDDEEDDDEMLPEIKDEPVEENVKGKSPRVSGFPARELLQDTPVDDDEDDDDEGVPLNIKDEPTDEGPVCKGPTVPNPTAPEPFQATSAGDEDEDAGIAIKIEPRDVDATAHGIVSSKATIPRLLQDTSFNGHPNHHITTGVASMSLKKTVSAHDNQSNDQELDSLNTQASEAPEPESLATSAQTLKDTLLKHISEWAKSASIFRLDLTKPAGELYLAVEVSQIAIASKSILQHVTSYYEDVGNMSAKLQQDLEDARAKGMPGSLNHAQEDLIRKYRDKEVGLRAVIEKVTQQVGRLEAGLS